MLYCENWDKIKSRYEEFWARENHDRPIISLTAPKDAQVTHKTYKHASHREQWFDIEYMITRANKQFQNTFFAGEAFPLLNPNLGPDLFAACHGTELEFSPWTSWAVHNMSDEDTVDYKQLRIDKQNVYYRKMMEMTKAALEDGRNKYFVGVTDIHPGMDALVSMRSPEKLCYDTLDNPEFIKKAVIDLFDGFKTLCDDSFALTKTYQQGSANWMSIWHPKNWYVTSCDFICMISEEMFEDFIIPELLLELDYLDASMFHLDGPGALRHLDRLLSIDKLDGIQWVYGAGQPSASHWLPVLKKIQDAGKCIQVQAEPWELGILTENLKPEGVMYSVRAGSEDEAKGIAERFLV